MGKKISTVAKDTANKLPITDYVEALLDVLTDNEVAKEVPVVSTALAMFRGYKHYREEKFREKVREFVSAAGKFTQEELEAFSVVLEAEGKSEQFINELLEIIERADSEQKAKIFGGVFRRLVKSEISYLQFQDQIVFTKNMVLTDIVNFVHGYHNGAVLDGGLGDVLFMQKMARRDIEVVSKISNMLEQETEHRIRTTYTLTGVGTCYLTTLHQVFEDRIDPNHLYKK
ncbi:MULTISPECIES: hypothetical protein [unclassified Pseudomonas]|uniref:hypothetical protein n=1 Tax=unclassified Pseudomonas TaxID=196821 RepID=UPI000595A83B|nr:MULTISPECIES: hypothetical protein [unclassified Pseudomonas]MBD0683305.1 hypothetical protein [Pseudomonas sp. PSB18]